MASSNWKCLSAQIKDSAPKKRPHKGSSKESGTKRTSNDASGAPSKKRKVSDAEGSGASKVAVEDLWFDDVNAEDIRAAYGIAADEKVGAKGGKGQVSELAMNKWVGNELCRTDKH
jgi:hypothetical protein